MYEFLLTVHVLAAVIWVGGGVMMHIFGRLATKDGPEHQLAFTQHSIRLGNIIFAPLAVILLVAGVLLPAHRAGEHGRADHPAAGDRRHDHEARLDRPGPELALTPLPT